MISAPDIGYLNSSGSFFQDQDLEEDFDAEKYDQKMKEVFNQDYYHEEEDAEKPEFPYDPDIDDGKTLLFSAF